MSVAGEAYFGNRGRIFSRSREGYHGSKSSRSVGEINDKEHLVAWLDLLGFAERIEREPLANLITEIDEIVGGCIARAQPQPFRPLYGEHKKQRCYVEQFQDTIILWTPEVKEESFSDIIGMATDLVRELHRRAKPVRGAISVGTLYTSMRRTEKESPDHVIPLVIGSGVKRAHDWESIMDLATVIVDPAVLEHPTLRPKYWTGGIVRSLWNHDAPTKSGLRQLYGLRWMEGLGGIEDSGEELLHRIWPRFPGPSEPAAARILENTRTYLKAFFEELRLEQEKEQHLEEEEANGT